MYNYEARKLFALREEKKHLESERIAEVFSRLGEDNRLKISRNPNEIAHRLTNTYESVKRKIQVIESYNVKKYVPNA